MNNIIMINGKPHVEDEKYVGEFRPLSDYEVMEMINDEY